MSTFNKIGSSYLLLITSSKKAQSIKTPSTTKELLITPEDILTDIPIATAAMKAKARLGFIIFKQFIFYNGITFRIKVKV